MKHCWFRLAGLLLIAAPTLRAQLVEETRVVGAQGLMLTGRVTANDPRVKVLVSSDKSIELPGQRFLIKLSAGKRYRIALESGAIDSVLVVRDAGGRQHAWDDDSGGGLNSLLVFSALKEATYHVFAASLKGQGQFTLSVRDAGAIQVFDVGNGLTAKDELGRFPAMNYYVRLVAGETYVIDMVSANPKALDPLVRIVDADGKVLAEDDDGGGGLNARILYKAETTGAVRLVMTSYGNGRGPFTATVRRAGPNERPTAAAKLSEDEIRRRFDEAYALQRKGHYREALVILERILPATESLYGKDATPTGLLLNSLGVLHHEIGQHAKAEAAYQRSLTIRETQLGKDHPDVGATVGNLGLLYRDTQQFAKAHGAFERSVQIFEARADKEQGRLADALNNLAGLYHVQARYDQAETLYLRSLSISEAQLGKEHREVARAVQNLALLYEHMGLYQKAESFYLRSLRIREKELGPDHPELARTLSFLAFFYQQTGAYAKAEALYRRSLAIRESRLGAEHPDVAESLDGLAWCLANLGRYAQAEPLYLRAARIEEHALGKVNSALASTLANQAFLYQATRRYDQAETLFKRSLEIFEIAFGPDHPKIGQAVSSLAGFYREQKQFARAEELYRRSLRIRATALGKDHPEVAMTRMNLASALHDLGCYEEADSLYEQSRRTFEATSDTSQPYLATVYEGLGFNAARQKQWARAALWFDKSRKTYAFLTAKTLPFLSESEQLKLLRTKLEPTLHGALAVAWNGRPQTVAAGAEWWLNGRALTNEVLAEQHLLARDSNEPRTRQLALALQQKRTQLAALTHRPTPPSTEAEHGKLLSRLNAEEEDLAGQLVRAVGRSRPAGRWVTLEELRARLGRRTAFVDFARVAVGDLSKGEPQDPHYLVWITPAKGGGDVLLIDLGDAAAIDRAVAAMRTALATSTMAITEIGEVEAAAALHKPLQELAAKVLHPLLESLRDHDEWVLCPDGDLWLVPWNALLMPDGKYAIEKLLFRQVVSGRDLVQERPAAASGAAVLFADPDFDLAPPEPAKAAGTRQPVPGSVFGLLTRVGRLPGTALEAEAVKPRIETWLGGRCELYLDKDANEAKVKAVRKPRVLALSTHGFFLPAQEVESKERPPSGFEKPAAAPADAKGNPLQNPLLRCGLLLAGCNRRSEAGPALDDGILTGLEVVGLDLRGTELVVLSACETGLGDVRAGEGVAGLRQAFQLAGARGVLASLWQVPDRETALLMNAFYGGLANGQSQAQALREAQLQRIAARRGGFGAAHPFFWAAFTLTGGEAN